MIQILILLQEYPGYTHFVLGFFSLQQSSLLLVKDDEPAAWDPSGPIGAALHERMWFLRQHCLAGPVLKMLARGKSTRKAKTDSRRLGTCWEVCMSLSLSVCVSSERLFLKVEFSIFCHRLILCARSRPSDNYYSFYCVFPPQAAKRGRGSVRKPASEDPITVERHTLQQVWREKN